MACIELRETSNVVYVVCVCVCVRACVRAYVRTYACVCVCVRAYVRTYARVCVCVCVVCCGHFGGVVSLSKKLCSHCSSKKGAVYTAMINPRVK